MSDHSSINTFLVAMFGANAALIGGIALWALRQIAECGRKLASVESSQQSILREFDEFKRTTQGIIAKTRDDLDQRSAKWIPRIQRLEEHAGLKAPGNGDQGN